MQVRFTDSATGVVRGETELELKLNLLAHAQILELEIGSRCGGYGECGGDHVRICEGAEALSALTAAEREHLSEDEIHLGWRLACQAFPDRTDRPIEVELRSEPRT